MASEHDVPAASRELAAATGLALDAYRADHVRERVRRALAREGVDSEGALAALLRADDAARRRFRRSVAVSVSGLFRDPRQFALLEERLLPPLLAGGAPIPVWCAGCADGSEAYSVALLLERLSALDRADVLGSDLLDENLAAAVGGEYDGRPIPADVRSRVRFEQRDLLREPAPPGAWRLVLCRNVAIYLSRAARAALHAKLAAALRPGGILLLGRSERVSEPERIGLERVAEHAYRRLA